MKEETIVETEIESVIYIVHRFTCIFVFVFLLFLVDCNAIPCLDGRRRGDITNLLERSTTRCVVVYRIDDSLLKHKKCCCSVSFSFFSFIPFALSCVCARLIVPGGSPPLYCAGIRSNIFIDLKRNSARDTNSLAANGGTGGPAGGQTLSHNSQTNAHTNGPTILFMFLAFIQVRIWFDDSTHKRTHPLPRPKKNTKKSNR